MHSSYAAGYQDHPGPVRTSDNINISQQIKMASDKSPTGEMMSGYRRTFIANFIQSWVPSWVVTILTDLFISRQDARVWTHSHMLLGFTRPKC